MKWKKLGLIFKSNFEFDWNKNGYASVPTVFKIEKDILRIYFASRDEKNRSNISFIDVEADNPKKISYIHNKPVITPGLNGTFDDCGVMPSQIFNVNNEVWLYYFGWNVRNTISYHNSIGLAKSKDNGITFEKFSEGPLFDRNYIEPYFSATPYILRENGLWRMWYLSNTKWAQFNGKNEPYYNIKYAESKNGIDWKREGRVAIDFKNENECGIARGCVLKDNDIYKMWYSYRNLQNYRINRNNSYRIGYAESINGIDWIRKDEEVGIDISKSGWDSEMIAYPFIFDHKNNRCMIYNGNSFGKTGFGYAIMDKS